MSLPLVLFVMGSCLLHPRRGKVYQGTSVFAEHALLDEPSGLCCFLGLGDDTCRSPAVAVAAGPYIFIYK